MDGICSTEKYISEYTITEEQDAEYKKLSVTKEECGRNILDRLDVTYERVCMGNPKDN